MTEDFDNIEILRFDSEKLTLAKGIPLGKSLSYEERDFKEPLLLVREAEDAPFGVGLGDEFWSQNE